MNTSEVVLILPDIIPVLIGGFVTLAGTVLVQLFVIPHVQTRTRNRERWERDVMELAALLEEELPRALDAYKWAGYEIRYIKQWQQDETLNQHRVRQLLQTAETETRKANEFVGQQMARLKILIDRARRVNRDAWYWRRLDMRRIRLHAAMFDVDAGRTEDPDIGDEPWRAIWDGVDTAREQLLTTVHEVAHPMKPPPRHRMRRLQQKTVRGIRRVWQRRTPKLPEDAEGNATPAAITTPPADI